MVFPVYRRIGLFWHWINNFEIENLLSQIDCVNNWYRRFLICLRRVNNHFHPAIFSSKEYLVSIKCYHINNVFISSVDNYVLVEDMDCSVRVREKRQIWESEKRLIRHAHACNFSGCFLIDQAFHFTFIKFWLAVFCYFRIRFSVT